MPLPKLTIRQRLPLFISLSALVILLLEGYFIYAYSVQFYEQEFRERIHERLEEADSLIARDRQHPFSAINAMPPGELPEEKILYTTDVGNITLPKEDRPLMDLLDTTQFDLFTYCYAHIGKRDYGLLHDSVSHSTLIVSAVDRDGQSKIRNLKTGIIAGIILGVLLLTLASWFWVKKMLQPIANKIKKARSIGAKSLNLRLDVKNNHDELGELALTFNEMLERIEHGFRTQQQFIRNASHEMRTPLTAITAEADLALMERRTPESYQLALEHVRAHAENLTELVAKLLLMASVESNISLNDQVCAADEVLLQALHTLQVKYPKASHSVHLDIESPDPSLLLVRCDPTLLQTAFFNLLDNAIKYGNDQAITIKLFVQENAICLQVVDQGMGIAPEELEHLFKPFYRSKQSSHLQGSGIGLSLVKSIVEKYQGSVHLESEPGKGTIAQIVLPPV